METALPMSMMIWTASLRCAMMERQTPSVEYLYDNMGSATLRKDNVTQVQTSSYDSPTGCAALRRRAWAAMRWIMPTSGRMTSATM